MWISALHCRSVFGPNFSVVNQASYSTMAFPAKAADGGRGKSGNRAIEYLFLATEKN